MNLKKSNRNINNLAEFCDGNLEKEFFQGDMQNAIGFIKSIVLILGILYTLFLIPDYFLVIDRNAFALIAMGRALFILLVFVFSIRIKFMKNFRDLEYWITSYEVISSILFIFIFYKYENPNYLIQAFGVMIIMLAIFMIPNHWINMIGVSLFLIVAFNALSFYYIKNLNISEFFAGIVYLSVVLILSSIFSFRNNCYKRIHYFDNKELIRLSITDPLTGIYNRAKFNDELKQNVWCSKKNNTPLSIMIIDFDDFKKINDTYGHLIGDNVIIECTSLIQKDIRDSDIFARWGGEEFVLILPNMDIVHSLEMGERLRKKIENCVFKDMVKLTCSFGVAQLSSDDDIESLLQKVDKMLYEAKSTGKNTVVAYQPFLHAK